MPNEAIGAARALACAALASRAMRRALLMIVAFVIVAGAALAAGVVGGDEAPPSESQRAGGQDFSARFARYKPASEPNGDLSKVQWPEYVTEAEPEVKRLYEFQITHGDLMRYMPCFCGCKDGGHRSNRDCYVRAVEPDGTVILDSMAPT